MRVPTGARKCSFIRPASTDGKKSVPTTSTSQRSWPATTRRQSRARSAGGASSRAEQPRRSAFWKRSKRGVAPVVEAAGQPRPARRRAGSAPGVVVLAAISMRASAGTSVRDSRYEASIASTTASASGVNRKLRRPDQQHHREEHDADGQRRDDRRHRDLLRAVQDGARSAACPGGGCGGCSRPRRWRRRPACRWPAPARPAS